MPRRMARLALPDGRAVFCELAGGRVDRPRERHMAQQAHSSLPGANTAPLPRPHSPPRSPKIWVGRLQSAPRSKKIRPTPLFRAPRSKKIRPPPLVWAPRGNFGPPPPARLGSPERFSSATPAPKAPRSNFGPPPPAQKSSVERFWSGAPAPKRSAQQSLPTDPRSQGCAEQLSSHRRGWVPRGMSTQLPSHEQDPPGRAREGALTRSYLSSTHPAP